MLNRIKNLFSKKKDLEFTDEEFQAHDEKKSKALENLLGSPNDLVAHAIIPFAIGGAVDLYFYPETKYGMAFVTKELINPYGSGPKPNREGQTYELIAFTKEEYNKDESSPFQKIEHRVCGFFSALGFFSKSTVLNPKETAEVPIDGGENHCLVFDAYPDPEKKFTIDDHEHMLLICIEVFRNEMEFAMKNGSDVLLSLLKDKGHYPYSDLNREPVV